MKPLWQEITSLIADMDLELVDIHTEIADYHKKMIYSLDNLEKRDNVSLNINRYSIELSLTLVTKTSDETIDHTELSLTLLKKIELYDADLFARLEIAPALIIDGSEFSATRFELIAETLHIEEML